MTDDAKTLGVWPLTHSTDLRVVDKTFQGRRYLDVRQWYTDEGGERRPSKKGVMVPARYLPVLAEAVQKALQGDGGAWDGQTTTAPGPAADPNDPF